VVVAVILVRPVQAAVDEIVDVIAVRYGFVAAVRTVGMRRITRSRLRVLTWVGLIDCDHVLVDMLLVRVVQVPAVEEVDVFIVAHCSVATTRAMLVRVRALVYLVGHAPTLRGAPSAGKGPDNDHRPAESRSRAANPYGARPPAERQAGSAARDRRRDCF
jgi:hypothetical protein